jgi:hypothetical protein
MRRHHQVERVEYILVDGKVLLQILESKKGGRGVHLNRGGI